MRFESALAAAAGGADLDALEDLARTALEEAEEERALPLLSAAASKAPTGRLLQWKALLERSLDEHGHALKSFAEAARLSPADASIAHGYARVALEAGVPESEPLYEQARTLAPGDGAVLLGLEAARLANGHGAKAEEELDSLLAQAPLWLDGHRQLAQLRSMLGRREHAEESIRRALAATPAQPQLWQALFDLQIKKEAFAELAEAVQLARSSDVPETLLKPFEAVAAAELGRTEQADILFAAVASADGPSLEIWRIRHLIRSGRVNEAILLIDAALEGGQAATVWPYANTAWRLTTDPRSAWLDQDGLVSVIDLKDSLPPLDELAALLRSLHVSTGEYLDQSLRRGTQTDGPLFSRIDPQIRALRAAIVSAVEEYVAKLPPVDPKHPLLSRRRDRRVRFAGSWSVRLGGSGFHVSHVHPQGWISSALYIVLPEGLGGENRAGWLQVGEPPATLQTGLKATAAIEPKLGQLVLFPSWMWHGTRPFAAGERISVAFDVAPPK